MPDGRHLEQSKIATKFGMVTQFGALGRSDRWNFEIKNTSKQIRLSAKCDE